MKSVDERRKQILESVISEYIEHALPISSDFLKNECALNVSPATIRMDLVELTKDGFLQKTHISSGRVPTDKGYRFFVDSFFEADIDIVMSRMLKEFDIIFGEGDDISRLSHKLAEDLAESSNNLSIVCFDDDILWKEGWEQVIKAPEFNDAKHLKSFVDFVNDFENKLKDINFGEGERVKIFIGKEAPSSKKEFSVVVGSPAKKKDRLIQPKFAILGPKRMNFKKNVALINSLIETVENFDY